MNKKHSGEARWGSRFGFLMVAAGASIGLGNVWKFPYLAYRGGGAVFLIVYLIIDLLLAKPMIEAETAIGRHGRSDAVSVFEKIDKKWGFVGWIANICTLMIDFYYVVVGGWVLRYAVQFLFSGNFGSDANIFYQNFISDPVSPLIWTLVLLAFVIVMLYFGMTKYIEKMSKVIMPALVVLLIICGVYACFAQEGALEGLKYYLLPDFSKFNIKVFADAVTQVLFSIGIGWGIFTTLGANVPRGNNLKKDALFISLADPATAILAGFVIIPSAFGAGIDVQKGPGLIFDVMANIFNNLPGGRVIGSLFFIALTFAVISSLFTFIEIFVRTLEIKGKLGRKKAVLASALIIGLGNVLVSLGFGPMNSFKLPWSSFGQLEWYGLYDWFDCFSGYVLLPLGCILISIFVAKIWGWKNYEKELTSDGRDGVLSGWTKFCIVVLAPIFMAIVLLNVFGFIK